MKKKDPITIPENLSVKLPTILKIKPTTYIPVFYTFLLIIGLFAILLYPGIRKNGSIIYLDSYPRGAAVYNNDKRLGSTPVKAFVPKGNQNIVFSLPNVEDVKVTSKVKGRIFGSLFFPSRDTIRINFKSNNSMKILHDSFYSFAAWNYSGKPRTRYQFPYTLTNASKRLAISQTNNMIRDNKDYLLGTFGLINSEFTLRDWSGMISNLHTNGKTLSASHYLSLVKYLMNNTDPAYLKHLTDIHELEIDITGKNSIPKTISRTNSSISVGQLTFNKYIDNKNDAIYILDKHLEQIDFEKQNSEIIDVSKASYSDIIAYINWFNNKYLNNIDLQAYLPSLEILKQIKPSKNWELTSTGVSSDVYLTSENYNYPSYIIYNSTSSDVGYLPDTFQLDDIRFRLLLKEK
ncbi:PEGA domain-containing protein [Spirochaeta cellobiosiphila]|uniref:PEGA domain-containing protein n=1 Tax=Spirochaeta cellobiosiphila TaxID=504483 RepID=UPI00040BBCBE|nr:PEGA domain-containing protein [Spirochaeta cellobiosiphila]